MPRWKPGPGWSRGKDGNYVPHFYTFSNFPGAQTVAIVFKVAAWLDLIAGSITEWRAAVTVHSERVPIVLGIAAVTILTASALAFFAYVLQLLIALHFDSRHSDAAALADQVARGTLKPSSR